ncbi:MAG: biliverdin-producing heme oxygenase [Rhodospirillales bacterium]|nr:biliverdin-producing heme oxygenase [Rhodospirillales bacterium]
MSDLSPGQRDRRAALSETTAAQHRRLDETLREGSFFASHSGYALYLRANFLARGRLESQLAEAAVIPASDYLLTQEIAADLAALGHETPPLPPAGMAFTAPAAWGALYVLQGASMGALHLRRWAAGLGYADGAGASHLALQAHRAGRWKSFLQLLNNQNFTPAEEEDCRASACAAFTYFEESLAVDA